jgi:hypothetical protein
MLLLSGCAACMYGSSRMMLSHSVCSMLLLGYGSYGSMLRHVAVGTLYIGITTLTTATQA